MLKRKLLMLTSMMLILFTSIGLKAQSEFASYGNYGSYQITKESNVGPFFGYDVYRPKTLSGNGELHPIITWGNGTGTTNETYDSFLRHLASYGFIVVATHSRNVGSGSQMINGISWLLDQNNSRSSKYYGKIDPNRIGATGHSQGGAGTINTAHDDSRVTCIAPLAPATFTYPYFYSTAGIECPIFIMVGSMDNLANPNSVYSRSYRTATTTAIFGELRGEGHMDITGDLGNFRKYVTAWFVANLWKDSSAEQLFFTENSPIYSDYSFSRIESKYLNQYDRNGDNREDDNNLSYPISIVERKVSGADKTGTKSAYSSIDEQSELNSISVSNYPNPFSTETMIQYNLSESNHIKLDVYDLMGKHIKSLVNNYQEPGAYRIAFNAQNLPGGIYFYVLESGSDRQVGKMLVKQ